MTEAVATFFGDDEFPVDVGGRSEGPAVGPRRPAHPQPGVARCTPTSAAGGSSATTCSAASGRRSPPTGSPRSSTATCTPRPSRPRRARRRGVRVRRPLHPAHPASTRTTPPRSAATSAGRCRTTPRTSSAGGATAWCPEMSRNFERFDTYDYDSASLVELAVLLEDAIDMHDRHWSIHWVLNFAQFSSTTNLNTVIAEAKGEGDHSALMGRLQSSTENRNWDSIEELWKIKEAVKNDGGAVAEAFRQADRRRRDQGARGHRGGPGVPRQGHRGLPGRVRLQVDVGPRVLLPHLARGPGPDRRGHPRLPGGRLRLPGRDRRGRQGPRGRQGRVPRRRARARTCDRLAGCAQPEPADEPADAGPPLLHRPGHQRPGPPRAHRDRREAGRGGQARGPRGRDVPEVQRAAHPDGRLATASTPRTSSGTAATTARTAYEVRPRDWVGTATEENAGLPVPGPVGVPREGLPQAVRPPRARSTASAPPSVSSRAPPGSCSPRSSSPRSSATRSWSAG